jgi:hypothetical protein
MKASFVAMFLGFALFTTAASAADTEFVLPTVPELKQQIATVKTQLPGKRGISAADKQLVSGAIGRIERTLGDTTLYSSLSQSEQLSLVNDFTLIEGLYHGRGEQRMVCERSRRVGSNRINTTCKTAAQWEAERVQAREHLHTEAGRACTQVGCV